MLIFTYIRLVGFELFHEEGQTDGERIKPTVGFRNCFANAQKKSLKFLNSGNRLGFVME